MGGWVAGLFGNITNSAPSWVGLGLGLSLAKINNINSCKLDTIQDFVCIVFKSTPTEFTYFDTLATGKVGTR